MGSAIKSLATVAVAGLALVAGTNSQAFAEEGQYVRPAHGLMLDVGSKHTVSYFLTDGSKCNLTLMIGEKANDEGENSSVGARVNVAVEAGKSARIETAEGKSLEFACAGGAGAMSVRALDVVAYTPATK
jgi:hypothetical protein